MYYTLKGAQRDWILCKSSELWIIEKGVNGIFSKIDVYKDWIQNDIKLDSLLGIHLS